MKNFPRRASDCANTYAASTLCALVFSASLVAFPGCDDSDTETGDEQDATSTIDDAFALNVIKGGCKVVIQKTGKTSKTKGKGGVCPTNLTGVLDVLKADAKIKTHTFVVSEHGDLGEGTSTPLRFVVAVDLGDGKSEKMFLSTLGSGEGVSETFIEVMSFSEKKGVYVYYDLEDGVWNQVGDGTMIKTDAAAQAASSPAFRCQGCHTTGAPLMKEEKDSWANWSSTWFSMPNPGGEQELLNRLFGAVERADDLEPLIIAGRKAYTKTRVDKAVKEGNLAPLMKQLMCDVGEPNLIAAHSKNSKRIGTVETFSSMVPGAILINQLLKTPSTGTGPEEGLDNIVNMSIPSMSSIRIDSASYVKALTTIEQQIGGQPGDAMFPMSSPEKSHADLQVVQELFSRGLIDKDLVTDVLMTDFTVSTFSKARCDLATTLPKTWTTPAELKTAWSGNLATSDVRGAAGLKARLDNVDDFAAHSAKVESFVAACAGRVSADKDGWALDLLKIVSQRRAEFLEHYEAVVESDMLIPSDNLGSVPGANRLSAETCTIEGQSLPFAGEDN